MKRWGSDNFGKGYAKKEEVELFDDVLGYNTSYGAYKLSAISENILKIAGYNSRILEVASGTGELAIRIAEKSNDVTNIDLSCHMINISKRKAKEKQIKNINFIVGDAFNLPFKDDSFDVVMERGLSLLIYNQFLRDGTAYKILNELKRVARCKIILIHQNDSPLLNFYKIKNKELRSFHYFKSNELIQMLINLGLNDINTLYVTHSNSFLFDLLGEYETKRIESYMQNVPILNKLGGGIVCWGSK